MFVWDLLEAQPLLTTRSLSALNKTESIVGVRSLLLTLSSLLRDVFLMLKLGSYRAFQEFFLEFHPESLVALKVNFMKVL